MPQFQQIHDKVQEIIAEAILELKRELAWELVQLTLQVVPAAYIPPITTKTVANTNQSDIDALSASQLNTYANNSNEACNGPET